MAGERFPCRGCGAETRFDPERGGLACPFCGAATPLTKAAGFAAAEHDLDDAAEADAAESGKPPPLPSADNAPAKRGCPQCGAQFAPPAGERTVRCPFCGSQFVKALEQAAHLDKPESLIPLAVGPKKAKELFTDWLATGWFHPSALKREGKLGELSGFYLPVWTFDAQTRTRYTAEHGRRVSETYFAEENGQQVTRTRTHMEWTPVSGSREDFFDDVLVPAAHEELQNFLERAGDFDLQNGLTPYRQEYLAGWGALDPALDRKAGWQEAAEKMKTTVEERCTEDVGGDGCRNLNAQIDWSDEKYKLTLLPYWLCAYQWREKPYRFVINGQTGKIAGDKPLSVVKIVFAVLLALAVIGVIAMLSQGGK